MSSELSQQRRSSSKRESKDKKRCIMNEPLISVIIPVYNVEQYLRQCLDSVLAQTHTNYEVIMVDDGSTDHSGKICDEYCSKDIRFHVIHRENGGLSVARNTGFDASTGEYVYFMDSDDWIEDSTLQKLITKAQETDADFVFFEGKSFEDSEKGYSIKQGYTRKNEYSTAKGIEVFDQLQLNKEFKSAIPTYLWKKSFLEANRMSFYPGILYEDMVFAFAAFSKAHSVAHFHEELYHRRFRAGSIVTSKPSTRNFESACIVHDEVLRIAKEMVFVNRPSVVAYISRVAMRPLDLYAQLSAEDKAECVDQYKQLKEKIKRAKGYGDKALYYRTYGKLPWAAYKVVQKITRR